ncbi:MAG: DUF2177 family protein [Notoacmeibacter sp.]|nr:DUF2177 family protein [Notoacmeibacter sp.]
MKTWLTAYAAVAVAFFALDFAWLSQMAGTFYRERIGVFLADSPNIPAAAVFYFLYVFGIVWFAVAPALDAGSWTKALVSGALFGLLAYATYDLTNMATLKQWPLSLTVVDMAWGAFATGVAATIGYWVTRSVNG